MTCPNNYDCNRRQAIIINMRMMIIVAIKCVKLDKLIICTDLQVEAHKNTLIVDSSSCGARERERKFELMRLHVTYK